MTNFWVRPLAAGLGDGSSWDNACNLGKIGALPLVPDDIVYVRADEGSYKAQAVNLSRPGAAGHPIIFRGVDVNLLPISAEIKGTRPNFVLSSDPEHVTSVVGWYYGENVFGFNAGADYNRFEHFRFVGVNKPYSFNAAINYPSFLDQDMFNVREGWFMAQQTVIGLSIRTTKAVGFSKRIVRWEGYSKDWTVEDIYWDSARQDGDNFSNGIAGDKSAGQTSGLIVRGRIAGGKYPGVIKNCHDSRGGDQTKYWNADAIALEHNNSDVVIQDIDLIGCTDAGIDSKARNVRLFRVRAEDNKRNWKFWYGPILVEECVTINPHRRGGTGGSALITILAVDAEFKNSAAIWTGFGQHGTFATDDNYHDNIVRNNNMVYVNNSGAAPASGTLILNQLPSGPPVITAPTSKTAVAGAATMVKLTASAPCSWTVVDGPDAPLFKITTSTGLVVKAGQYLWIGPQTYVTDGNNVRTVSVMARDVHGVASVFTFTLSIPPA